MTADRFNFRIWDGQRFTYSKDITYDGLEKKSENYQLFKKLFKLFYMPISLGNEEACIIQQSTGYQDENGKEIYEGDFISVYENNMCCLLGSCPAYTRGEIKYYNSGFYICQQLIGGEHFSAIIPCNCCPIYGVKVIGNIYEK